MKKVSAHTLIYVSRRILLFAVATVSLSASAASFDCTRARQPDEKAICASRTLSEMDVEMAVRFEMMTGLVAMGARGDMGDEQLAFLKKRHACGSNRVCLQSAYQARIQTLKDQYASLKSRGPF